MGFIAGFGRILRKLEARAMGKGEGEEARRAQEPIDLEHLPMARPRVARGPKRAPGKGKGKIHVGSGELTPKRSPGRPGREITIEGKTYPSLSAAAREIGLNRVTLEKRYGSPPARKAQVGERPAWGARKAQRARKPNVGSMTVGSAPEDPIRVAESAIMEDAAQG